jgi:hypothetical protein
MRGRKLISPPIDFFLTNWNVVGNNVNVVVDELPSQITVYTRLTLKGQCRPTGLVLFWENLVQNFYSIAPNGVFRMENRAPQQDLYFFRIEPM